MSDLKPQELSNMTWAFALVIDRDENLSAGLIGYQAEKAETA